MDSIVFASTFNSGPVNMKTRIQLFLIILYPRGILKLNLRLRTLKTILVESPDPIQILGISI